jgi:acetyl esterase/lipase
VRPRWAGVLAVVAALVAGCSSSGGGPVTPTPQHLRATVDYLPGVAADVFLPAGHAHRAPVVVLVPGGGWVSADRSGLRPLADTLTAHGMVAVAATYRTAQDHVRFPVPVSDVVCAVAFAVRRARAAGIAPGPVVVLGHSAGAQLAALAALAGPRFRGHCPYPAARVDGLVGLAGPYDVAALPDVAQPLFGASASSDPAIWRAGNPLTWVRQRPELRVLLVHGTADTTVPPSFTASFARRLRGAGHRVTVELVPGADHGAIYRPEVVAARIIPWISGLE